jgi:hypothetical protein
MIREVFGTLSSGEYQASFVDSASPPPERCAVVTVTFDVPRGVVFRDGVDPECNDPGSVLERAGGVIQGGELHLPSDWISGFAEDASARQTLLHELGHVAGLYHSYRGEHVMGQGVACCLAHYSPVEVEALSLLYRYPAGTTVDKLMADRNITPAALHPFPHLDEILRWDQATVRWTDARNRPGGGENDDFWAEPGDWIVLHGSRMTLRWITEPRVSFRPPEYAPPEVHFGGVRVAADPGRQRCPSQRPSPPCAPGEPSNSWAGQPTRWLKVQVPADAESGWIWIRVRGLESNPVWLRIS